MDGFTTFEGKVGVSLAFNNKAIPSFLEYLSQMTIRDMEKFVAGIWDWGFLDSCFEGTRIKLTDIDGFVERKGKFLVLETKQPGVPVPRGQKIMFEELQKTGLFTIIVVWGRKNQTEEMQVYCETHITPKKEASNEDLQRVVTWWFQRADNARIFSFKESG